MLDTRRQTPIAFLALPSIGSNIKSGNLRALAVLAKKRSEIAKAFAQPEVRERFAALGFQPVANTPGNTPRISGRKSRSGARLSVPRASGSTKQHRHLTRGGLR